MTKDEISKHQILLVEDDYILSNMYITKFDLEGFIVVHAKDGLEALHVLKKTEPSIILLDLFMPRLNGFDFLDRYQNNETQIDIPIIILTNVGDHEIIKALDTQIDTYNIADIWVKTEHTPAEIVEKTKHILDLNNQK